MKLHCFVCASPLFPDDLPRDQKAHGYYLDQAVTAVHQGGVALTVIQNGCSFPTAEVSYIRNPIIKNLVYNWLICDANCNGDYWIFLPEDCYVKAKGWHEIKRNMEKNKDCFTLSRDPKALVGKRGIFEGICSELQVLCDMNFLGKEIGGAVLLGTLYEKGLHSIGKHWKEKTKVPENWGNDLYETINLQDHPDINRSLKLPILQDYGLDGWERATQVELESAFEDIVMRGLEQQRLQATSLKGLIAHYGPLITEVPYKGPLSEFFDFGSK